MNKNPAHKLFTTFTSLTIASLTALILGVTPVHADYIQLTDNDLSDGGVRTENGKVVWSSSDDELYLYDVATATTTQITDNDFFDSKPIIKDGKIVWEGFISSEVTEIFLYDIASGTTTQVTNSNQRNEDPRTADGKVVWNGFDGNDWEIFVYDSDTATTTQITNNSIHDGNPIIENGKVGWNAVTSGTEFDTEVKIYDLATSTTTQITDNTDFDVLYQIFDGKLLLGLNDDTDSEIYIYDIATSSMTQFTNNTWDDFSAQYENGKLMWVADPTGFEREIFLHDFAIGTTKQITVSNFIDDNLNKGEPQISDGQVVWSGHGPKGVYLYDSATDVTTRIFDEFADRPRIGDGNVVWIAHGLNGGNDWEIFLWNASIQNNNTPPGTGVSVGGSGVQLSFSNVTGGGDTTITTSTTGAPPPTGFKIGNPPTYFSISTTATFTGTVEVCIDYSSLNTFGNEDTFRLMHREESGQWIDITTSIDTENDIICGETTSFSDFAVMAPPIIPDLITTVQQMNLQQGISNSLDAKLSAAQEALNASNNGQSAAAVSKLQAFVNEVEAQSGNKLTVAQANELKSFANNLIKLLQGVKTF